MTLRFSIITVTWNAATHLEKCIQSVAAQSCPDHEYIIVDSASTDGTQALVERHRATVTQFVSEPDDGIYDAMNKGIARARGDYLLFLGADDYLYDRDVLCDATRFLAENREVDFAYGNIEVREADGTKTVFRPPPPEDALEFMVCGCLPHQASFARRDIFDRLGRFDLRYKVAADYDWFLRVLGSPESRVRYFNRIITSYFSEGLSNDLARSQPEVYAIQNSFPGYQGEAWSRVRIAEYQRHAMHYRIELQRAQRRLDQLNGGTPRRPLSRRIAATVLARAPYPVADYVRTLRRRLGGCGG